MTDFAEAIALLREKYADYYICEGYEYGDKYIFELLHHYYKQKIVNQGMMISVSKDSGEIADFDMYKAFSDLDAFTAARRKKVLIDNIKNDEK